MIIKILLAFIFMIPLSAQNKSKKKATPPLPSSEQYIAAKKNLNTDGCKSLDRLSKDKTFIGYKVAQITYLEHCLKKKAWNKSEKDFPEPWLKPFFIKAKYDNLYKHWKYVRAYELYKKYPKWISLDKKQFEDLVTKSLKNKMSKRLRRQMNKELRSKSPRFIKSPKKDQFLKVAKDFRKNRQFEKALSFYKKVINQRGFSLYQKWYGFKGARATYKLERWKRMNKYLLSSKQWANFLEGKYKQSKELTGLHHNANIEYVRTLWTEKGQKKALPVLLKLERQIRKRYSLQMVYWLKGRMAEELRNYKDAVNWLNKASKQRSITLDNEQRVLWSLAWNQRRIQDYRGSQKTLDRLLEHKKLTFFAKTKSLYWKAENYFSLNKKSEGKSKLKKLMELDPYGYYGSLAHRKANEPFPPNKKTQYTFKTSLKLIPSTNRNIFTSLIDMHEYEIAESLLNNEIRTKKSWNLHKWVSYFYLLQEAQGFKAFFYKYHTSPAKIQSQIAEEYPQLLFPKPYKDIVTRAASQSKVSEALIYSIMKQESGFDRKARSFADAFGLLQLIPQVAEESALLRKDIHYKKPRDLYLPEINIPLGAETIRRFLASYKNQFILGVATYNANPKAVNGWVQSRYFGDPIDFIEEIPYEETKGYIKLVMRNYIAYNRFESSLGERMEFPEVCLEGLQDFKK